MGTGALENLIRLLFPDTPIPDPFDAEEIARRSKDLQWTQERIIDMIAAGVAKGIAKAFGK
ncbi:hypothetical protein LEP1GSC132_0284 [Leptospira kirschneri str. 200803703]|uniref:Uncharacterized protein n=1 Tax=Leptospira kirschneri str. 200802841 TaxID=1193047 RepID=A0A828Y5W8_9LEPT|nr:hypothetical protein [Leptospira kirschneri]EKO53344.1 hypothetical protein LEP1GSC131_1049 [Leptospira kirschneri str. 200802841]EMO65320.1 hypothetical protein LEP1GSC132_0056 [Leptospira kirschneri str. 200803703]EMO67635.1 hypothetical protein LEP1GSC132_0284 [Leptospira kirschneri str. 200803703]